MGSKSDMPAMEAAAKELTERGILHEMRVMSAHRDPDTVADYAKNAKLRGLRVIIAGAGLSAALPGVVAAHTHVAGDRRPADVLEVDRGRARRPALDRADAPGRAGGLRGRRQRAQRGRARRADPRQLSAVQRRASALTCFFSAARPFVSLRLDFVSAAIRASAAAGLGRRAGGARGPWRPWRRE